jgi:hypothetical protein
MRIRTLLITSTLFAACGTMLFAPSDASGREWSTILSSPDTSATPATQPSKMPERVVGKWHYGSVSALQYVDGTTGQNLGSARGNGEVLIFKPDGTYEDYVYIEMRTYDLVSRCFTTTSGTCEFTDGKLILRPAKGHYLTTGSRNIDRDMTEQELKDNVRHYNWHMEKTDDGEDKFVIPFDDGSRFEYRREKAE